MKNIRLLLALIVITLITASCAEKPKIGFLMDTVGDRWNKDRDMFIDNINKLGGKPIVKIADSDQDKQFKQAEELIKEGVSVMVLIPVNLYDASKIVDLCHSHSIQVISYDRLVRNSDIDYYISTDNIDVGEMQAKYISSIRSKGNYLLIGGSVNDYNSQLLYLGWMNVLQPLIDKGDVNIIGKKFVKYWKSEQAYNITINLLKTNSDISAIIAGNDILAKGAIKALHEYNLDGKVLVAGQDADIDAIKNILAGHQTISIYKPIAAIASGAANIAMKIAKGEEPSNNIGITINNGKKMVPSLLLESQIVNKENIRITVVSDGFIAEQEIFE